MAVMESPEEALIRKDLVAKCIGMASLQEQQYLIDRFGLKGDGGATREELGQEMGVNIERVRQIECRAIRQAKRFIWPHGVDSSKSQAGG